MPKLKIVLPVVRRAKIVCASNILAYVEVACPSVNWVKRFAFRGGHGTKYIRGYDFIEWLNKTAHENLGNRDLNDLDPILTALEDALTSDILVDTTH